MSYSISSADVVLHPLKQGKEHLCRRLAHSSLSTLYHGYYGYGGDDAIIAGQGIIVKHTGIHAGLMDYVVGDTFEEDSTDGHLALAGAILHVVEEAMLFGASHEVAAKKFREAQVEVCFDERDALDVVEAGGAGVFEDEGLGDGFPALKGLAPIGSRSLPVPQCVQGVLGLGGGCSRVRSDVQMEMRRCVPASG
jgi:hypothetical protein